MWCIWTKKEKGKVYDLERSYGLTNEKQNTLLYILAAIRRKIYLPGNFNTTGSMCCLKLCHTLWKRQRRRCRIKFKAVYHYRPSLICVCTSSDYKVPKRCLSLTCACAQIQTNPCNTSTRLRSVVLCMLQNPLLCATFDPFTPYYSTLWTSFHLQPHFTFSIPIT